MWPFKSKPDWKREFARLWNEYQIVLDTNKQLAKHLDVITKLIEKELEDGNKTIHDGV